MRHNGVHIKAPAKVNLQLSVGPKEEDGYHNLVTAFQALSLYDDIRIQLLGDLPPGIKVETISEILMEPKSITRMSELKALAQRIENVVHDGGYPLFKVIVPDQEISVFSARDSRCVRPLKPCRIAPTAGGFTT